MSQAPRPATAAHARGPMRHIEVGGSPIAMGRAHGAAFASEIRRYADERIALASNGSWAGRPATRADVLALAEAMLPAHRDYSPPLYEEMRAMAEASGLSPAEALIAGGFTDFVDAVRGRANAEDTCTAVLVPDALADGRGFLAQTWDMHDSATEHVLMLELRPERGPRALVFSTVGCLGQIGMNEAGIAIGINNLAAAEGAVGVTWPLVVRKALMQDRFEDALACITGAPLCGAHNYLLFDRRGRGANVEAMPQGHVVTELGDTPLYHTNHCLAPEARRHEAVRPPALMESSRRRLARAEALLGGLSRITPEILVEWTRDPEAICQRASEPFHIESSGAVLMRPAAGDLWAVWGLPSENEYRHFRMHA